MPGPASAATRLYGLFDMAADPNPYALVTGLEPGDARCLFEGRLAEKVRRASPFLAELVAEHPLTEVCRTGRVKPEGLVLIESPRELAVLRRRLRRFTQARLPNGDGPVLFRFWDPRVLSLFLPTLAGEDLETWFIDAVAYLYRSPDAPGWTRLSRAGGAVAAGQVAGPAV